MAKRVCHQAVDAVLKHESVSETEAVALFEEPRRVSKYAGDLEQLEATRKIRCVLGCELAVLVSLRCGLGV